MITAGYKAVNQKGNTVATNRLKISENLARTFHAMISAPPQSWLSSSDVAARTGSVERSTCYHQLKRLLEAGLIEESVVTSPTLYRIRTDLSKTEQAQAGFIIQAYDVYAGRR